MCIYRSYFKLLNNKFQMENTRASIFLLILAMIMTASGQSYFAGLNIDPVLLSQADAAINNLKLSLQQNFKCQSHASMFPNLNDFQRIFLAGSIFFPFKSIHGFTGYNANPPIVTCLFGKGAVFYSIYQKVVLVTELLQKVRSNLIKYNNIIIGNGNNITGSNNMVIGSKDNLNGNNNWVFTSDYTSTDPLNGVLIIGMYLIELQDLLEITYNPTNVIHCIEQEESNQHFNNFWGHSTQSRRFCF